MITKLKPNQIFVFGSNGNGNHAGGAAKLAKDKFGAIEGQARGLQGQSYAIETLNKKMQQVSLRTIKKQIYSLFDFAKENADKEFLLTKVGCGIAGFQETEVRNCFNSEDVPTNVTLPKDWIYRQLWKSMPADMAPRGHKFKVGKWYQAKGEIEACSNGFHASERIIDAMGYVNCEILARVEIRGVVDEEHDKVAAEQMRIIRTRKWTKKDSVKLSIFAAEQCIEIFERLYPGDDRPRKAIEAAKYWLKRPGAAGAAWAAGEAAGAAAVAAGAALAAAEAAAEAAGAAAEAAEAAGAAAWAAEAAEAAGAAVAARAAALAAAEAAVAARAAAWAARATAEAAVLDSIEKYILDEIL